jgi:hypothetical protein
LKDCSKLAKLDDVKKSTMTIKTSKEINLLELKRNIISKIFDKSGDFESRVRNKIIYENKKRFTNGCELIDTKYKCLKYLQNNCETFIPSPINWIKYCCGKELFLVIIQKYYYNREELKNAMTKLNIFSFEDYKMKYHLDKKLPKPDYINDGFYYDMDCKFDIMELVSVDDYDY